MEEDFYNKIKELSIKFNESNMYFFNIKRNPLNHTLHSDNFLNLKKNINDFDNIYKEFKKNIEDKYYLFKCFYDLFINFLKNISGFIMYLKIYEEYAFDPITKEKYSINLSEEEKLISHLDSIEIDILETFETYQIFNFKQLLRKLNLDSNLTNIHIQDLISLNIERDLNGNLKSPYLDIIKVSNLPKKHDSQLNTVKNIENFINYLHYLICNYIYNIIKLFKDKDLITNYITIPQYHSICWFVSMITGFTYSDLNRQLIVDKNKYNLSNSKFKDMIMYIINNITDKFKEYNFNTDCYLLKYLKEEPIKTLNNEIINVFKFFIKKVQKKLGESIEFYSSINKDEIIMSKKNYDIFINGLKQNYVNTRYSYFANFIDNNKKDFNKKQYKINLSTSKDYAIYYKTDSNIIRYFYKLLNINTKYFYVNMKNNSLFFFKNMEFPESDNEDEEKVDEDEYDYHEDYKDDINDSIDVIIIEYNNIQVFDDHNFELIKYKLFDIHDDIKTFKYKGFYYKLDYILHYNDKEKDCKIDTACHHCISAITYNKKEYIYDSGRIFNYITCDDKINYNIPCSLIKQEWKKNINEDITYCTTNCKYYLECNIDETRKSVCYTFNTDIFYIYVKIPS
jgi:hypothetical protein